MYYISYVVKPVYLEISQNLMMYKHFHEECNFFKLTYLFAYLYKSNFSDQCYIYFNMLISYYQKQNFGEKKWFD